MVTQANRYVDISDAMKRYFKITRSLCVKSFEWRKIHMDSQVYHVIVSFIRGNFLPISQIRECKIKCVSYR